MLLGSSLGAVEAAFAANEGVLVSAFGTVRAPSEFRASGKFSETSIGKSGNSHEPNQSLPATKCRYKKLRIIAVDAGHGGEDEGTIAPSNKLKEKTLTLDLCLRIARLLEESEYKVILVRQRDEKIPLLERARIANLGHADIFVCIHFNAAPTVTASGIETFILPPSHSGPANGQPDDAVPGNAFDGLNAFFGHCLQSSIVEELQAVDRGVKQYSFTVLRDLQCPGALVECGFLSNASEAARIASVAHRDRLAQAIVAGIRKFDATVSR
ncbi:MAG: N-acetylmuramoyl-L-alanine amidase [Puniceicoccales bacterium]|nr:N-acetylmuramoyl-L-alanine amidase [Puniceicoccales bacterium]